MKYISIIVSIIFFSFNYAFAQCVNNPQLQNESIVPAPLINNAGGTFSFDYTESLLDHSDLSDPVQILISMQNIAPVNGVASVTGSYASNFSWQYDPGTNAYLGTQIASLPGGAGGSIAIEFVQTNPIDCPDNQMGFLANIIPADCMIGQNDTSDDSASSYTCRTIVDEPIVSVSDAVVTEGGTALVQICLDAPATSSVSIDYTTSDGSANASSDYTANSNTLSFDTGEQCKTIQVLTTEDNAIEGTENFFVTLSNPSGVMVGDGSAVVTINDNDVEPTCEASAPTLSGN